MPIEVLSLDDESVTGWVESDEDEDYANSKVVWPALKPVSFKPENTVQRRIDNIASVRLAKALAEQQRTRPRDDAAAALLWMGLCRTGVRTRRKHPPAARPPA
jgi:hypothetical protein